VENHLEFKKKRRIKPFFSLYEVQNCFPRKVHFYLPFTSTSKTVKQHTSKTVRRQTDRPAKQNKVNKKVTYYIKDLALVKKLKLLGVEKERDLSGLVTEAIEDLIKKYE